MAEIISIVSQSDAEFHYYCWYSCWVLSMLLLLLQPANFSRIIPG